MKNFHFFWNPSLRASTLYLLPRPVDAYFDIMRNNFKVLLLFSIIASLFLTESQRQATAVISDESEQQLELSMETATRSKRTPRARGRGRCRLLRRRQRCVKWCTARMKAKEIDRVDWKKMFAATVFIIGLVHIVYFCHPVCHPDRELG